MPAVLEVIAWKLRCTDQLLAALPHMASVTCASAAQFPGMAEITFVVISYGHLVSLANQVFNPGMNLGVELELLTSKIWLSPQQFKIPIAEPNKKVPVTSLI